MMPLRIGVLSFFFLYYAAYLPHAVMFSFPIVFSYIGSTHQDYRFRRNNGGSLTPERESMTSNVPFVALLQGTQDWSRLSEELKWTNAAIATLGAVAMGIKRIKSIV